MKTRTWIVLFCAVFQLCLILSIWVLQPREDAALAQITSGGKIVKTVDLRLDQEFTVETGDGGYNVVTVKDGKIAVTAASCPDHYCKDRGFCSGGVDIVCLPNKMVIRFLGEQEIDGIAG